MLYVSIEDFYEKAELCRILTRQEELEYAEKMKEGDGAARRQLIQSYLPTTARHIKRSKPNMQTLLKKRWTVSIFFRTVRPLHTVSPGI